MTDQKPVTHEETETAFDAPKAILDRLPDSTETRSARRNLDIARDYVSEVIEKVKREH